MAFYEKVVRKTNLVTHDSEKRDGASLTIITKRYLTNRNIAAIFGPPFQRNINRFGIKTFANIIYGSAPTTFRGRGTISYFGISLLFLWFRSGPPKKLISKIRKVTSYSHVFRPPPWNLVISLNIGWIRNLIFQLPTAPKFSIFLISISDDFKLIRFYRPADF